MKKTKITSNTCNIVSMKEIHNFKFENGEAPISNIRNGIRYLYHI